MSFSSQDSSIVLQWFRGWSLKMKKAEKGLKSDTHIARYFVKERVSIVWFVEDGRVKQCRLSRVGF